MLNKIAKLTLVNQSTDEILIASYNPPNIRHGASVNWNRSAPLGQTSETLHYGHTSNRVLPMKLFFDVYRKEGLDQARRARKFLEAGLYPQTAVSGLRYQAPATFLVVWPKTFALYAKLMSCFFDDQQFQENGEVVTFEADCVFETIMQRRWSAREVRNTGLLRS